MSTPSNLNSIGQAFLAGVGSVIVNAVVHPLCTIKNRLMANESPFPRSEGTFKNLKALYRGYTAMCLTESASFAVTYVSNGLMKSNEIHPLVSAILAGAISTPVVTAGEALMVNSQVNGKAINTQMLRTAMQGSGLIATMLREIPFSVSIFALPSVIETRMPFSNALINNVFAGLISGCLCGAITAPADKIKTLVQAKGLPFRGALAAVSGELTTTHGRRKLLNDARVRALYIGLAVAILNVINNQIPQFLPKNMKN